MSCRAAASLQRTTQPKSGLTPLLGSETIGVPKTKDRMYKSMASTVSRSREATYEIELCTPRKPANMPLCENIDVRSNAKGGRRKQSEHAVPSYSASVRSVSGSTVVVDKLAMRERIKSASQGQFSKETWLIRSMSAYSNRSAQASAPRRVMRLKPMDGNDS